jgi:hypothetical protein
MIKYLRKVMTKKVDDFRVCISCDKRIPNSEAYCFYCGYPIKVISESQKETIPSKEVIQKLFPSRVSELNAWREYAERTGNKPIEKSTGWWIFRHTELKVVAPVGAWWLTLSMDFGDYDEEDGYQETTTTRMVVRYRSVNRFQFEVYSKDSPAARWPSSKIIKVGDPGFARNFIVQGDNAELAEKLFSLPYIRDQVSWCLGKKRSSSFMSNGLSGSYNPRRGWGSLGSRVVGVHGTDTLNDLVYVYEGIIEDSALLLELHQLFAFILNQLLRIGCAVKHSLQSLPNSAIDLEKLKP